MTGEGLPVFGPPVHGRSCAACKLCCTLVPVELHHATKPANVKCDHLGSRGCRIYAQRPDPCRYWSCRWLFDTETAALRRPDHAGYVLDPMHDEIRQTFDDGRQRTIPVLQVWCDPHRRDAWRDPALLDYLELMARKHQLAVIVRWSSREALVAFAPAFCPDGEWHEVESEMVEDIGLFSKLQH